MLVRKADEASPCSRLSKEGVDALLPHGVGVKGAICIEGGGGVEAREAISPT